MPETASHKWVRRALIAVLALAAGAALWAWLGRPKPVAVLTETAGATGGAATAVVARSIHPQATTATDRHRVLMERMAQSMNGSPPRLPYFALRNTALPA